MPAPVIIKYVFLVPEFVSEAWESDLAEILAVEGLVRVSLSIAYDFNLVWDF